MAWPPRGILLVAVVIVAALIGGGTAIASVLVHEKSWAWLALALAAPLSATWALSAGWLRSGFGLGWLAMVFLLLQTRPEGDYVVLSSARGYGLLVGGLAMLVFVIVTLPVRRRTDESG
ncbi:MULTISPECIES: hypothetical protein [unclassified Nocardioides]|uniref:hypothetical protein n=1 Tax=unclassified Nocardioides TaxID=2615069 RepID=UPI000A92614C|nr:MULTISPECIES: hypothetical protein [unclassified Nocardioides]